MLFMQVFCCGALSVTAHLLLWSEAHSQTATSTATGGAAIFAVPASHEKNESGAGEGVRLASAEWESLVNGDSETATHALLEAIPDHASLPSAYDSVFACVSEAQGEVDVEAMKAACPYFHRWHAHFQKERPRAILQWIAQKFWEMPDCEEKEALYCRFLEDLDRLVQGGAISADQALAMACSAVYAYKRVEPLSSISPCLIDFVAKQARSVEVRDPERLRDIVIEVRDVTWDEQQRSQLSKVLQAEFPETQRDASFRNHGALAWPISRRRYMSLLTLPLEEIYERTVREGLSSSYTRDVNYYGDYALGALLARYDESPDEVTDIITRMIREGVKVHAISQLIERRSEMPENLRRAIVEGLACRLTLEARADEFHGLCRRMALSLKTFGGEPQMPDLQQRIGEILIEATITSEKRQTLGRSMVSSKNVAYDSLIEGTKSCGATVKAKLAGFVAEKLANKTGFQDSTPECQDAIMEKLRRLEAYLIESDDGP